MDEDHKPVTPPSPSSKDWETCLRVLQQVSEDISLAENDERFKGLVAKIGKKARKQVQRAADTQDAAHRVATGMVRTQQTQQRISSPELPFEPFPYYDYGRTKEDSLPREEFPHILNTPTRCYICKLHYRPLHFFYHLLCPNCARMNYSRRSQRANLKGRIALLTGGRIKIGYQMALRMLRDGAQVIVTTRFPQDAARRFSQEEDFSIWQDRLKLYALDLRRPADVESFADHLAATLPYLDIIINNAAQTVKRPLPFYRHLLKGEEEPTSTLPSAIRSLLPVMARYQSSPLLELRPDYPTSEDAWMLESYFPPNLFDGDGQQVDTRPETSWSLRLDNVSAIEMVEVQLVNAVAPFILNGRLKRLLKLSPHKRRFIVNVSAMEGQFERETKTANHPHTNMAKAALNMLTRTSAQDYAESSIYMTSVDTGWVTDENPLPKRDHIRDTNNFYPPLDVIDGMARIYDPIVRGLNLPHSPAFGAFYKDYRSYPW